uniref:PucR family transcriptional regulator n=1 Tax=Kribbia dieselivorans TaxID=331526 RepID=UPI0014703607
APAWPAAPRPCLADDLIAERALAADGPARSLLHDRIWIPLTRNESLLETASAYLESRGGLEGTARTLFVHTNTVRYRLGRITDVIGYDLTEPHDAFTVRVAIALGRLGANATAPRPRSL